MSGFIAMQRDALDHPVLHDAERFRAWFWLVANAAWRPTRSRISGQIITLKTGQLSFSIRFLAEAWGWSKSRVDRFLSELRSEGMIETCSKIGTVAGRKAGQAQSVITICNYAKYQTPANDAWDSSGTQSGTAAGQQRDKEEQGNKGTRKNITARKTCVPDDFWPEPSPKSDTAREMAKWGQDRLRQQVERFIAHHQTKGNQYINWQQAWTNWALSDFQKQGTANDRQQPSNRNAADLTRAKLAAIGSS